MAHLQGAVPVHRAAAVAGHCVSLACAVLPACLLLCNLYQDISRRSSWNNQIPLSKATINDLEEWQVGLAQWNSHMATTQPFNIALETDASLSGWGAALKGLTATSAGWWQKQGHHINELELKAILKALHALAPLLQHKSVLICCDNITAVAYINHLGSCSITLNKTTHKIFNLCKWLNIQLSAVHLPGVQNGCTNQLSRLFPQHKWHITPHLFKALNMQWGPHSINCMASTTNTLLPHFNSHFWEAGSEAVNTMVQDWCGENNWVTPPIALLPKVIHLVERQHMMATIITPMWSGHQWYQDLCHLSLQPPVPITNQPESFKWFSELPEPLQNHQWRWAAFRICGSTELKAGAPRR